MTTRLAPFRDLDLLTRPFVTATPSSPVAMDAVRSADSVTLSFDLPGFDAESISLDVERNLLTLSAERSAQRDENDRLLVGERRHGKIRRQLRLSESLDLSSIDARFDNGVLSVHIPVAESAGPNKVEIAVGPSSEAPAVDPSGVDAEEPSEN